MPPPSAARRRLLFAAKWLLLTVVLAAVVVQGLKLGRQVDWAHITIRPGWLLLSTLLYVAGWLPAVWFWRELLREVAGPVSWFEVSKAYFCGHLGKYVPGKAGVIFIRAGMLQKHGVPFAPGALSAGYETLASMAAGAAVGGALLPFAVPPQTLNKILAWLPAGLAQPAVISILVLLGSLCGLRVMSQIFHRILKKMVPMDGAGGAYQCWSRQPTLLAFLLLIGGWWIHGLSMGCTVQALSPDPVSWSDWPRWTAATSLSIVLGFAALFSPGGLGVREWILMEVLEPELGPLALVATVLSRFIWLVGECGAAGILYYWPAGRNEDSSRPPTEVANRNTE